MSKLKVLFLMGPTASGKTDLAIALREKLPVELISVDSALVYRGLDIGSAKPTEQELAQAPHRLLDIRDPSEPYSAADFCEDAMNEIREIHEQGRIPLLVGGTMLYFKALLEGMADMPAANPAIRADIELEAQTFGWPHVHQELAKVDPDVAAQIHPNHSQRISRALEVFRSSGKTMTELRQAQSSISLIDQYDVRQVAIAPHNRALLHQRIEQRFQKMLDSGFEDEVRNLKARGDLHAQLPAIRAVGYRQMWEYLDGEYDKDEMLQKGLAATRQLAKRQITWLRGWSDLNWVYIDTDEGLSRDKNRLLSEILSFFLNLSL